MAEWEYMIVSASDKRRPHTGFTTAWTSEEMVEQIRIPKWDISFEKWLNQLGMKGWEVTAASGSGWGTRGETNSHHELILKRQLK